MQKGTPALTPRLLVPDDRLLKIPRTQRPASNVRTHTKQVPIYDLQIAIRDRLVHKAKEGTCIGVR